MEIKRLTDEILGDYISLRNLYYALHSHPELSFEEFHTAETIALQLRSEGIEYKTVAKTGILARIEGGKQGAAGKGAVVLRADIDALPITEHSASPSPSAVAGVMHACGHDMHATVLVGALTLLNRHRDEFGGTFFGLFQPGEELNPGGASVVLAEDPFAEYDIKAFVGEHIEPTMPTGNFGLRGGKYMAACDELHFTIRGKGGHAALRDKIKDPVAAAAKLIDALYELPKLNPSPDEPTILSIGRIVADGATNVVPDTALLEGTMRCFDEGWRTELKELIRNRTARVAAEGGVEIDVDFGSGYPPVVNDSHLTAEAAEVLKQAFGANAVEELGMRPTGEDFGFYTERYPSLFYRLGAGYSAEDAATGKAGSLHSSSLCPDPKAIGTGVAAMVLLARKFLQKC